MVIRKAPVNLDDQENIDRFLEQMMRKNYESAFTPSKQLNSSATSGDTVESGSSPNRQSSHSGLQHATMKGNSVSEATTPVDAFSPEGDKPHEQDTVLPPHASRSSANTPAENAPDADPSSASSKTVYRSRGVSLNAESEDAFAHHQISQWMEENCPPSHRSPARIAPPQSLINTLLQSPQMSGLQAPPPTPEAGPVSQRDITNIFHSTFDDPHGSHPPALTLDDSKYAPRRKSILGPKQGSLSTSASTVAGGDMNDSNEGLHSPSSGNAEPPPHLRASKSPTAIKEGHNKKPLSPHSSAYHNMTGGNWIPPHLRPPTKEFLAEKSHEGEVARILANSHGEAGSNQHSKCEEISSTVNITKKSETDSHNDQGPHSRIHSKQPTIIFTGDVHDLTPAHKAPGLSMINPDGDNHWRPGEPESGFLAAPFTPTEQATHTPAGSSAANGTPPHLEPREESTDVAPRHRHEKPAVVSALLVESLKHAEPLASNPFTSTAATADHSISSGPSKVPATVAAVDNSLSAVADVFKPSFMASMKPLISIKPPHPLSAQGNPFTAFSETNSTPRSVFENGVITPSSMIFTAISPSTAAAAGITAAMMGPNEGQSPEDVLFFRSWPKSDDERRPGKLMSDFATLRYPHYAFISSSTIATLKKLNLYSPAARIRKVIITNLPLGSTANFVQSLVFGGPIEQMTLGSSSAAVVFVDADDTKKYYDATANGLVYKTEGEKKHFVLVELAKDVDVVGGLLREMLERSMTRCVKAIGVEEDWGMPALWKMAERKGRKVENIVDGVNAGGSRTVTFRFCNMLDAKAFLGVLQRDEEWEHCNIIFAPDPCAHATGVHFD